MRLDAPASLNVVHAPEGDIGALISRVTMRNDNVLVEVERAPRRHGSLHLPDSAPRPIDGVWARVLRVGPGHRHPCSRCGAARAHVDPGVQVGARVLLDSSAAGDRWHIGGREHRVVRAAEILALEES